jgi:acyl-coenzyme A thioesterase PaaI-like protein
VLEAGELHTARQLVFKTSRLTTSTTSMIKQIPHKMAVSLSRSIIAPLPARRLIYAGTSKASLRSPSRHLFQCFHARSRPYSTTDSSRTPIVETPAQPTPRDLRSQLSQQTTPPSPRPRKRRVRLFFYATIFLMLGLTSGQYVRWVIMPPPHPEPGTKEDAALTAYIHSRAAKLPIVQSLSTDPAWHSWDAYSLFSPEERAHRITTGPLGGSRGIGGYQRIFQNVDSGEFVSVVWIGGSLAGWPGVTHGGLIATILDESLGRCAISTFPEKTGVTANLELNYRAPTVTNDFYVIRAMPVASGSTDRKRWVSGRLETVNGRVCVDAKGLFVVRISSHCIGTL